VKICDVGGGGGLIGGGDTGGETGGGGFIGGDGDTGGDTGDGGDGGGVVSQATRSVALDAAPNKRSLRLSILFMSLAPLDIDLPP